MQLFALAYIKHRNKGFKTFNFKIIYKCAFHLVNLVIKFAIVQILKQTLQVFLRLFLEINVNFHPLKTQSFSQMYSG